MFPCLRQKSRRPLPLGRGPSSFGRRWIRFRVPIRIQLDGSVFFFIGRKLTLPFQQETTHSSRKGSCQNSKLFLFIVFPLVAHSFSFGRNYLCWCQLALRMFWCAVENTHGNGSQRWKSTNQAVKI